MNKRIKELAEQAYIEFFGDHGVETNQAGLQAFAELIVNECIGVVRSDGDHWEKLSQNPPKGQEQFRDHMLYSAYRLKEDAVWSIQDHFELEPSKPYGAE
jgi:hypothetical protein